MIAPLSSSPPLARLCAALVASLTASPALAQLPTAPAPPISGHWTGGYVADGSVQSLSLDVVAGDDGLDVRATLPDHRILDRPIRDATYADGLLSFEFEHGATELAVDLARGEMRGTATDDGETVAVHLVRAPPPPKPPIRVEEVRFESRGVTLAGSLVLPEGGGPHPAIVFVAGRSYGDRWGAHSEAVRLARHGIAGLVFDGRGRGASGGARETTTDEDRYADAVAAIDVVRSRADIDRSRIGLWSESAGGWVVPEVAHRTGGSRS